MLFWSICRTRLSASAVVACQYGGIALGACRPAVIDSVRKLHGECCVLIERCATPGVPSFVISITVRRWASTRRTTRRRAWPSTPASSSSDGRRGSHRVKAPRPCCSLHCRRGTATSVPDDCTGRVPARRPQLVLYVVKTRSANAEYGVAISCSAGSDRRQMCTVEGQAITTDIQLCNAAEVRNAEHSSRSLKALIPCSPPANYSRRATECSTSCRPCRRSRGNIRDRPPRCVLPLMPAHQLGGLMCAQY